MKRILLPILIIGILLLSACVETTTPPAPSPAPAPTPTPSPQPAPAPAPDVPQQKVKDIETIMGRAERLGIKVQSIAHASDSINISCEADEGDYITFRDYKTALGESGRFTTPVVPPEGYPYTWSGTIKVEPKFQYIDMPAVYHEVNLALSPLEVPAAIAVLVSVAEESGINVDPASGKFNVPPPGGTVTQTVGGGTYQVLPFRNIKVQGDYENVIAFISDLDSRKTLRTMILTRVDIGQIEANSKIETIAIVDVDIYER